jgi:hypothetical protein
MDDSLVWIVAATTKAKVIIRNSAELLFSVFGLPILPMG